MRTVLLVSLLAGCTVRQAPVDDRHVTKARDATQLTRMTMGLARNHPYRCSSLSAQFGDEQVTLATCEGASIPGETIWAIVGNKPRHLTLSRPGVSADIELVDLTDDGVPEALITTGGGGTLEHALYLGVFQWTSSGFTRLGSTTLRSSSVDADAPDTAFAVSGRPLCIAPANAPEGLYSRPTTPVGPGVQWVFDAQMRQMVEGESCDIATISR